MFYEDLCNEDFLEELLLIYDFTHIVHCAAQAGVRYSLEHPLQYVTANVQCFLSLLDALKHANKVILLEKLYLKIYNYCTCFVIFVFAAFNC